MHPESLRTSPSSPAKAKPHGIAHWMQRALKERERVKESFSADAVHDLRVALRRCRTIGAGMMELDEAPSWRVMRKLARKPFRRLGKLRDTQVMQEWVDKLAGGAYAEELEAELARQQAKERERAEQALQRFDRKRWKKLIPDLTERAGRLELNGPAARQLALQRLEEALRLHRRALRADRAENWHLLRIGLKRLRYVVENFVPAKRAVLGPGLERLQDLLGEAHDLQMLLEMVEAREKTRESAESAQLVTRAKEEQAARLAEYRARMTGRKAPWPLWRRTLRAPIGVDPALTPRAHGAVLEWPAKPEDRAGAAGAPFRGRRPRIS